MFNAKNYEPKTVDDLVFVDEDTRQRIEDYADGLRNRHMILHGPRGTGKSSTARVISETRCGGKDNLFDDAYEGSSFSEANFDRILNGWRWQSLQGIQKPVTVINEIDLLSTPMLEKLKSFIDQYGHYGQIIGTTNNEHKLSPALQDRFDIIEMPALTPEALAPRVREMALAEGVDITDEEALYALEQSTGSWRDAISATEDIVMEVKRTR